eukprot:7725439-Pyramimonas_sp.AAC.1
MAGGGIAERFMDRQGGWGSCVGKDRPARALNTHGQGGTRWRHPTLHPLFLRSRVPLMLKSLSTNSFYTFLKG